MNTKIEEEGIKKRMHSHIWRATGISIAESEGVPLSQIMERSGHRNIQSLKPYLRADENETKTNISNALNLSEIPQPPQEPEKPKQPKPKLQSQPQN